MCSPRTATRSTIAPVSPSPYRLVQRRVRRRRVGPPLRQPILGLELGPLRIEHLQKCRHPFAESQARQLGGALASGARFLAPLNPHPRGEIPREGVSPTTPLKLDRDDCS